ncbi:hypothetical protein HK098_004930 [Nowakowskiella sp. JEL0407]|nr:hypothetical protein HK098_004930 [Nowakowskiella sp. JEL0407]
MEITLSIKCSNETKLQTAISPSATVRALKEQIALQLEATAIATPAEQQRLIFSGRVLKDDETLAAYKIASGNTIHLVRGAPKPASASTARELPTPTSTSTATQPAHTSNTSTTNTSTSSANTTSQPASTSTPNTTATQPPSSTESTPSQIPPLNPLGGLFGPFGSGVNPFFNPASSGTGTPGFGMPGGPGQMNPALLQQMMSNPAIASSVSQLFSNPQFLDNMIQANPQLAGMITPEMRTMMQSEDFRRVMSDPEMIRNIMTMEQAMAANGGGFGGLGGMGGLYNPWASGAGIQSPNVPTTGTIPPTSTPTSNVTGTPTNPSFNPTPMFNPAMLQMLMGAGGGSANPTTPARPPEELYQVQLRQLVEMGFFDARENVQALTMTGGNVEGAVEYLLSHPPGQPRI